jgi:hypothetical protein
VSRFIFFLILVFAAPAWAEPSPEPQLLLQPTASEQAAARRTLIGLSFGLGALGVGGFILGGVEASRDGRACTPKPPATECPVFRNTANGQLLGFIGGGVTSALAVAFGVLGWWKHPAVQVTPAVGPGGASLSVEVGY